MVFFSLQVFADISSAFLGACDMFVLKGHIDI